MEAGWRGWDPGRQSFSLQGTTIDISHQTGNKEIIFKRALVRDMGVSKNTGVSPKMDGEINGKPY